MPRLVPNFIPGVETRPGEEIDLQSPQRYRPGVLGKLAALPGYMAYNAVKGTYELIRGLPEDMYRPGFEYKPQKALEYATLIEAGGVPGGLPAGATGAGMTRRGMLTGEREIGKLTSMTKRAGITPEFREWFGKSIVTENGKPGGKPLVVYHGSRTPGISEFSTAKINSNTGGGLWGEGLYFTHHKSIAESYARERGGVYPAYLAIKNPASDTLFKNKEFVTKFEKTFHDVYSAPSEATVEKSVVEFLKKQDELGMSWTQQEVDDLLANALKDSIPTINIGKYGNDISGLIAHGFNTKHHGDYGDKAFSKVLKAMGYDGFISSGKNGPVEYIAFSPTQIKSVFNRGTWSATDPDILKGAAIGTLTGAGAIKAYQEQKRNQ